MLVWYNNHFYFKSNQLYLGYLKSADTFLLISREIHNAQEKLKSGERELPVIHTLKVFQNPWHQAEQLLYLLDPQSSTHKIKDKK